jgi:hypothetical protein
LGIFLATVFCSAEEKIIVEEPVSPPEPATPELTEADFDPSLFLQPEEESLLDPNLSRLNQLQRKLESKDVFFDEETYNLLDGQEDFPDDILDLLLKLDFVMMYNHINHPKNPNTNFFHTVAAPIAIKFTHSPCMMATLLLQLEWMMYVFQSNQKILSEVLVTRYYILDCAKQVNPLIFHFFRGFICKEVDDIATKVPNSAKLLAFGLEDDFVLPMDVFDAIDFFARKSSLLSQRYLPRAYLTASLILATDLPYCYNRNDMHYNFTLERLCSLHYETKEPRSLDYLMNKFSENEFDEPLSYLYAILNRNLFPFFRQTYLPDPFEVTNPLILSPSLSSVKTIDELVDSVFDADGYMKVITRQSISELATILSYPELFHEMKHNKTIFFIYTMMNPAIFMLEPEEAFELVKSKVCIKLGGIMKTSVSTVKKVSEQVFKFKADKYSTVTKLCQTFWQNLLISLNSRQFYSDNASNKFKTHSATQNVIFIKDLNAAVPTEPKLLSVELDFFKIIEAYLNVDWTLNENQQYIGKFIKHHYQIIDNPEFNETENKVNLFYLRFIQDLAIQSIRAYKQPTDYFFRAFYHEYGLEIPTFIPELFPVNFKTQAVKLAPEFAQQVHFVELHKFITDSNYVYTGPQDDDVFKFLHKITKVRHEFNLLLAGELIPNPSPYIANHCSCLILKKNVDKKIDHKEHLGLFASRPIEFYINVDQIISDFVSNSRPVSSAILISTAFINGISGKYKITSLSFNEIANLLGLNQPGSEFSFKSFSPPQIVTLKKAIKLMLSRYFFNISKINQLTPSGKLKTLAFIAWGKDEKDDEINTFVSAAESKIIANCLNRLLEGKIKSYDGLKSLLRPKVPEKKPAPVPIVEKKIIEVPKVEVEKGKVIKGKPKQFKKKVQKKKPKNQLRTVSPPKDVFKKEEEEIQPPEPEETIEEDVLPPEEDTLLAEPENVIEEEKILPPPPMAKEIPPNEPSILEPPLVIPISKPKRLSEPKPMKFYTEPVEEPPKEGVKKQEPGIINLGSFGKLVTVTHKENRKTTNYSVIKDLKDLQEKTLVIRSSNFYDWKVFDSDLRKALMIAMDNEYSGTEFDLINEGNTLRKYDPRKDKDILFLLRYQSTQKHSILRMGFVLTTYQMVDGVLVKMLAPYIIEGAPGAPDKPDLNVYFSSYDFLTNHGFRFELYRNMMVNLQNNDIVTTFKRMLTSKVPIFVHNGIYDVLHMIKLCYPFEFKQLNPKNVDYKQLKDKTKIKEAILEKSKIENLDKFLDIIGAFFIDTRHICDKMLDIIMAEAKFQQKEKWGGGINQPYYKSLPELAYLLLDIDVSKENLHSPEVDAELTRQIGEFCMDANKKYIKEQRSIPGAMPLKEGEAELIKSPYYTSLEKYKNQVFSAQRVA